jgi:hypothetical protein
VLVAREPDDEPALYAAIEALQQAAAALSLRHRARSDSVRLHCIDRALSPPARAFSRRADPDGQSQPHRTGGRDTTGINALLFGIASELRVAAILTTQVSGHARRAVREADVARRMMYAAREGNVLPKGLTDELLTVHAKRPFRIRRRNREIAHAVRDPNFRIQVAVDGVHIYNRDGLMSRRRWFQLWPH